MTEPISASARLVNSSSYCPDEIAAHIRACIDDGSWTPRVVDLPYYDEPICPITRAAA